MIHFCFTTGSILLRPNGLVHREIRRPKFAVFEGRRISKLEEIIKILSHQFFSLPFIDKWAKYRNHRPRRIKTKRSNDNPFTPAFWVSFYWQMSKTWKPLIILPERQSSEQITWPSRNTVKFKSKNLDCGTKMWIKTYMMKKVLLRFKRFLSQTCGYPPVRDAVRGSI